jgi:peptidoglycan/LPS O-acetylase OafA/YrhL
MNTTHLMIAAAYELTTGRALTLVAIPFGILGVVLGVRALRAARLSPATGAASIVSVGLGVWVLLAADGGPGTGNGVVGAAMTVVLGAAGLVLGGLAHLALLRNERRKTHTPA